MGLALIFALKSTLVDVSDILNFSCSREEKGESEAPGRVGGGSVFLLKIPGGGLPGEGGGGRGARRVSARNLGVGGGGAANFFFFGAEMPTKQLKSPKNKAHSELRTFELGPSSSRHLGPSRLQLVAL